MGAPETWGPWARRAHWIRRPWDRMLYIYKISRYSEKSGEGPGVIFWPDLIFFSVYFFKFYNTLYIIYKISCYSEKIGGYFLAFPVYFFNIIFYYAVYLL